MKCHRPAISTAASPSLKSNPLSHTGGMTNRPPERKPQRPASTASSGGSSAGRGGRSRHAKSEAACGSFATGERSNCAVRYPTASPRRAKAVGFAAPFYDGRRVEHEPFGGITYEQRGIVGRGMEHGGDQRRRIVVERGVEVRFRACRMLEGTGSQFGAAPAAEFGQEHRVEVDRAEPLTVPDQVVGFQVAVCPLGRQQSRGQRVEGRRES